MKLLQKQYTLLKASREVVLNFLETQVGKDLHTPVLPYNNRTIRFYWNTLPVVILTEWPILR